MSKIIRTYICDGRLTRRIDESELAKRAEQLVRSSRMPTRQQYEAVLSEVLGPGVEPQVEPKKGM